ncbi:MAG: hypothetical protein OEZ01_04540 [Candidatus Heimdallarchaeota archaeon]|nr:hypothetical protein [Candidatus Heimdallarchaeota archaeon]MDH5645248.1 hypothetical protein [Candidatus Heimdallarchaeota archaeon]
MSSVIYIHYTIFKGLLNQTDDDEDELDFGEFDTKAHSISQNLDKIQPHRFPELETDYLGSNGDVDLIFNFRITWMDRESDIEDYLDDVQQTIENELELLIFERQNLGIRQK